MRRKLFLQKPSDSLLTVGHAGGRARGDALFDGGLGGVGVGVSDRRLECLSLRRLREGI